MDGESISSVFSATSKAVYDYLDDMQYVEDPPKGVSENHAIGWDVKDDFAVLSLSSRLPETTGLILRVDGRIIDEEDAGFTRYDDFSKTIVIRPPPDVLDSLSKEGCVVSILIDMKFLVRSVGEFYNRYGSSIGLPIPGCEDLRPIYSGDGEATSEQRAASEGILSHDMAYVWGAPGTGKTQFVLASAIHACLHAGERIAVFAPTNNSVEQVLNGILKALPDSEKVGIMRLGIPSKDFYKLHPDMCEDRHIQKLLDSEHSALSMLEEVRFERLCDSIRDDLEHLIESSNDIQEISDIEMHPDLAAAFESVSAVCSIDVGIQSAIRPDGDPYQVFCELHRMLFDRPRPVLSIKDYAEMSDSEIAERILDVKDRIEELGRRTTGYRMSECRIIASTPHQFISRFRPKGSDDDGRMVLDVDRIFLDEAGYCGLALALTLFSNRVPVIMLGDHMQLPPVSELDPEAVRSWAQEHGRLRNSFLWTMPAFFCEEVLTKPLEWIRGRFLGGSEPSFAITARYDLTNTHRFGENLASVLDRYVYRNGLHGAGRTMSLRCLDSVCDFRDGRENQAEAEAIRLFLDSDRPDPEDTCILTPYSSQKTLLWKTVPRRYRDCVMTVHGSQGREWGTVILSVSDNGVESRPVPYRFTSSSTEIG